MKLCRMENFRKRIALLIFLYLTFIVLSNKIYFKNNESYPKRENEINFEYENNVNIKNLPKISVEAVNVCFTEVYADGSSEEWIEIYNPTDSSIDLTGWEIRDGSGTLEASLTPVSTLGPKQVITIGDYAASTNYNDSITLTDGGDELILEDASDNIQDVVVWGTGYNLTLGKWYWKSLTTVPAPDDPGESIYRINQTIGGELEDNNLVSDWKLGTTPTPGSLPKYIVYQPSMGSILISEVMYGGNGKEWIELFNNESFDINLGGCILYSFINDNKTVIPSNTIIKARSTLVIGEQSDIVDLLVNLSLNDNGDVLILNSSENKMLDVVCWGTGAPNFQYGANNGWIGNSNATGGLSQGNSIFRYNLTHSKLSETNSSSDWYMTNKPTPGKFYQVEKGDLFFSEIGMSETYEFIELFNNLTWPIVIGGVRIYDYGYGSNEVIFSENTIIPPRSTFVVGDSASYNYTDAIILTDSYEDLVLYRWDDFELDVIIYGNDVSNKYPWGPNTGWIGPLNATGGLSSGTSLQRINTSTNELQDTDTSADWIAAPVTLNSIPKYTYNPSNTPGSFTLSENADNPDTDGLFSLNWTISQGANNYLLYTYNKPITEINKSLTTLADLDISYLPYNINATNGIHYYAIAAYNETGYTLSNYVSVKVEKPPGAFLLTTDADDPDTDGLFNLIWTNSDSADNYSIYMYDKPITKINNSLIIISNQSANSPFFISNYSGTYYYIVVAFNNFGNTSSNYVKVNIKRPKTILISEVMYGGSDLEWIELFNYGDYILNLEGLKLFSYINDNNTIIPNFIIHPKETIVIGEDSAIVDISKNISLNDVGDVLILNNTDGNIIDVVCWGNGANGFIYGAQNGWINSNNATGGLPEGSSIFRYNLTRKILSETNSSKDWYTTSSPTPGSYYKITSGDILFSEIGMFESDEFIELYNNFTWPVTLDGMIIYDYGGSTTEIAFSGSIVIPPRNVIVVGDSSTYNYTDSISLNNNYEDLVIYRDSSRNYVLDVIIYGNSITNTYPRGPDTGWNDNKNVTGEFSEGYSLNRINGSNYELQDTNTSADWIVQPINPFIKPKYIEPGIPGSVLITELMINVDDDYSETGREYIELYNPTDQDIDLSYYTLRRSKYWSNPEVEFTPGTVIHAKSYLTVLDDYTLCNEIYDIVGDYFEDSFTLTESEPSDIILADIYENIIDHVAWRTSSQNYSNPLNSYSWKDEGVYKGSDGKALARLYDPYNGDVYIDTNSSSDWRYNVYPSIGRHTNTTYFLSTPFSGSARIIAFNSPDNSFNAFKCLIGSAKKSIDICVYQFTSTYILEELINAMNRGVKVRLILEDGYPGASVYTGGTSVANEVVYVAREINNHENGSVRWESKKFFSYTHAKYMIIDNETVVISTENFKPTGIPKETSAGNRGWGIAVNNSKLAGKYLAVFNFDWSLGINFNIDDIKIAPQANYEILQGDYKPISDYKIYNIVGRFQTVIGPDETIDVIVNLINRANSSIYAELFYLYPTWTGFFGGENNNPFLKALINASSRGVVIKVILDSTFYNIEGDNNNDEAASILRAHGIEVKYSKNENGIEKFHVKALVVDEKVVMISSLNWAENSATNNREIGIIVSSMDVASYYVNLFNYDWENLSDKNIPESAEEAEELIKTYTWLFWLPIATIVFLAISIVGYLIRREKEIQMVKALIDKDKLKEMTKDIKAEIEKKKKYIPIDLEDIRNKIEQVYGAAAWVSHLDFNGAPLDDVEPSEFVQEYIKRNHELIEIGQPLNPLPEIVILKYGPQNYIAIESYLNLNIRMFELQNILQLWEVS
ncbi:MAG: lamin tail domain-containing protein [Promethearchaeota archaeon]